MMITNAAAANFALTALRFQVQEDVGDEDVPVVKRVTIEPCDRSGRRFTITASFDYAERVLQLELAAPIAPADIEQLGFAIEHAAASTLH